MDTVEQAKAKGRKAASGLEVSDTSFKYRANLLDRLNAENPAFVHMYAHPDTKPDELARKGQEVVKGDDGILHHKGDPVVRMNREVYEGQRKAEGMQSLSSLTDSGVKDEVDAIRIASPKKPREVPKRKG